MSLSYVTAPEMNMDFQGAKLAVLVGPYVIALLRDSRRDIVHPDLWDLPGGGRESGEGPLQCALRETHEELGLRISPSEVIWGRRFCVAGRANWFFAAPVGPDVLPQIVMGDEGRGWAAMSHALFMRHPKAIPHFADRLALCLAELGGRDEKPPAVLGGGR
ncbi:NUDIX hydrolase [Roseobacter sp.]|uniref:NUDIX hydrolase n=1 Tax=Roseobacter sp. TaxID=1907202 RepID=UPI003299BE93